MTGDGTSAVDLGRARVEIAQAVFLMADGRPSTLQGHLTQCEPHFDVCVFVCHRESVCVRERVDLGRARVEIAQAVFLMADGQPSTLQGHLTHFEPHFDVCGCVCDGESV